MKFIIKDWMNNTCFHGKTFEGFEEAWGFIYEFHKDLSEQEFDEQMGEYYVEEVGTIGETNFLEPKDIRNNKRNIRGN